MSEPVTRDWDTPGLPPRTHRERCANHELCAYRDDDPAYCPWCHQTWTKVDASELNRSEHLAEHAKLRERKAKGRSRRADTRARTGA